ncbi:MAG: ATP-binding protein [Kineosporiaceae bacterium]
MTLIGVATVVEGRRLERELRARRASGLGGRLAAGVAHEINTPIQYVSDNTRFVQATVQEVLDGLAGIAAAGATQGAVDAAVRECLGRLDLPFLREEVPAALAQAMEGLERVAAVVRAMKAFSDPAGLFAVDVNDLVRAAVGVAENRWRDVADTRLDLDPAAGQATLYAADLRQALLHLLVNAAQAVEDRLRQAPASHRGTIVVGTRRIEGPGGAEVRIWVGDDGVGMPSHVLQRAFDPFFTTRDVGEGSGQGLSFAHATVVAKHGGRLDVVSEPGSGSTFTMAVPAGVGAG